MVSSTPHLLRIEGFKLTDVAEGYYGNDYPEDELDSDDEYDNDAYKHWHGAFDDEDFEGNTNWSDDEYASKSARSST